MQTPARRTRSRSPTLPRAAGWLPQCLENQRSALDRPTCAPSSPRVCARCHELGPHPVRAHTDTRAQSVMARGAGRPDPTAPWTFAPAVTVSMRPDWLASMQPRTSHRRQRRAPPQTPSVSSSIRAVEIEVTTASAATTGRIALVAPIFASELRSRDSNAIILKSLAERRAAERHPAISRGPAPPARLPEGRSCWTRAAQQASRGWRVRTRVAPIRFPAIDGELACVCRKLSYTRTIFAACAGAAPAREHLTAAVSRCSGGWARETLHE